MICVIACHESWCLNLASKLESETDFQFKLISDQAQLTLSVLDEINPDYIFFPHWSYLIPEDIYSRFECVIFHMTDLPYGRGGSPLQNLIIRGHQETKLSAIKCVKQLDAGPIYLKETLGLQGSAKEIFMLALIELMIVKILKERLEPIEQQGEVTVFHRRTPEQSDWSDADSLEEVYDRIRMLDAEGYPSAFVKIGSFKLEFNQASLNRESVSAEVKITKVEE